MVRKEILTVSLMAGGYPIDGKSKEKTEKMHPEIWKRWIAFFVIVVIAAVVVYFAFAAQTPVKNEGPPQEVKTQNVQPAENAVVGARTGAVVIISTS